MRRPLDPTRFLSSCLAGLAIATSTPSATAGETLIVRHRLPATLAHDAARDAVAACEAKGHRVSAAVVDVDGGLQAVLRGNGAGLQTVQSAIDKAITSAMYGVDSSQWVDRAAKGQEISPLLNQLPHLILARGGVVIKIGDETIGGIAVGGAPDGRIDEDCARSALDSLLAALVPSRK